MCRGVKRCVGVYIRVCISSVGVCKCAGYKCVTVVYKCMVCKVCTVCTRVCTGV